MSDTRSKVIEEAAELIVRVGSFARAHGREDLVDRLRTTHARLEDPSIRVLVIGEYKKGKSSLVNAIIDAGVCKVDCDAATAVPTLVGYADEPVARVHREPADGADVVVHDIPRDEIHEYNSEIGNPNNERRIRLVEARLPRDVLRDGLVLVDTPGVGGLVSIHGTATIQALPFADAMIFVTDASQELTAPELEFMKTARGLCPNILCAMTKIDMYPEWRRIRDLNNAHLQRAGLNLRVGAVSSALRMHALREGDERSDMESGVPGLIRFLSESVVARAEQLMLRGVTNDLGWVLEQLESAWRTERSALDDPAGAAALAAELDRAKTDANALRERSARWQQTLGDGMSDLNSNIDHDLRARFRELGDVAIDALDRLDPKDSWDDFSQWLHQRVGAEVAASYALIMDGAERIASAVAEKFERAAGVAGTVDVTSPLDIVSAIGVDPLNVGKQTGVIAQLLMGLRGSYGNIAMVSMFGGVAGIALTLTNPITIAVGALAGGKAVRDQRSRMVEQRRQAAKASVRKFLDDVSFKVGKDKSDQLRRIQRELRDGFIELASQLQRSAAEALLAAQDAARADHDTRRERSIAIDEALGTIQTFREQVAALGR